MDKPVLVLNSNFEPINICSYQRAIGMMLTEKASLIMNGRGTLHTATEDFPIPSVIRLSRMVHPPRLKVYLSRREIFRRDHFACQYCGQTNGFLTIDHVVPRRLGGPHIWSNLVTACTLCNHRKGGRTLEESGMKLFNPPKDPPRSAEYIYARYLDENAEWQQFLSGW
jgi:5-methylcytosine-specific restriction endonuclease McrA